MRRSRTASLGLIGVLAGGLMLMVAPAANALPMSTIQQECAGASGSFQSWYLPGGGSFSTCTYTGVSGGIYRDYYDNSGNYTQTCRKVGRTYSDCWS